MLLKQWLYVTSQANLVFTSVFLILVDLDAYTILGTYNVSE